jgi:hypothetical protein
MPVQLFRRLRKPLQHSELPNLARDRGGYAREAEN